MVNCCMFIGGYQMVKIITGDTQERILSVPFIEILFYIVSSRVRERSSETCDVEIT